MITVELLEPTVGPRSADLIRACYGTITQMRRLPFLKWSVPRITFRDLVEMTIGNTLTALAAEGNVPIPDRLDLASYVNDGAKAAFAEVRSWHNLDKDGKSRENPRRPMQTTKELRDGIVGGFDIFRPEQFVVSGRETEHSPMKVDLSMLSDEELWLLDMLGRGLTQAEVAEALDYRPPAAPSADHRAYVQARLRTIRRKVCGQNVTTQSQAAAWLRSRVT